MNSGLVSRTLDFDGTLSIEDSLSIFLSIESVLVGTDDLSVTSKCPFPILIIIGFSSYPFSEIDWYSDGWTIILSWLFLVIQQDRT